MMESREENKEGRERQRRKREKISNGKKWKRKRYVIEESQPTE